MILVINLSKILTKIMYAHDRYMRKSLQNSVKLSIEFREENLRKIQMKG